jgi:hypothetical protein
VKNEVLGSSETLVRRSHPSHENLIPLTDVYSTQPLYSDAGTEAKLGDVLPRTSCLECFYGLLNDIISMLGYVASNDRMAGQLNCKERGHKSYHKLQWACNVGGSEESYIDVIYDNVSLNRHFNPRHSEYEARSCDKTVDSEVH